MSTVCVYRPTHSRKQYCLYSHVWAIVLQAREKMEAKKYWLEAMQKQFEISKCSLFLQIKHGSPLHAIVDSDLALHVIHMFLCLG